ncbi:MAG: CoB--CoM heterodisulfide reductase iron-sulfur subunit A family protein, partial [Planctomycetes bacterium]|nr:CoB--CoM heterodisulfide reductase iron-sulfur subunit A family protein [Planctomycetota bacterium]
RDARGTQIRQKTFPPEIDVAGQPPRIGVFVCHCGTNIASVVNVPEVVEYVRTLPDVAYAENNLYTCSNDTQEKIKKIIVEQKLNRIVVASCTPRTHEPLFRNTLREAGLNPYLFEMANIREHCSWAHMHEPQKATRKAKDLVRMAVAKARLLEPLKRRSIPVTKSGLVIGGGASGLVAAFDLAEAGFDVHLVEKEKELGGNLRKLRFLTDGMAPLDGLSRLVRAVTHHPRIKVHTDTQVKAIDGFFGNFKTTLGQNGTTQEVTHGVVIVATGAQEHTPTEYLYGQDQRVITQTQLEDQLASGKFAAKNVVMIQCVGSREQDRPYCSRVCCAQAIKNALKIKEQNPDASVTVLYRDVRAYGFREALYRQAREKGVIFLRYDEKAKPKVEPHNGTLRVLTNEPVLRQDLLLAADLVALSPAIVPNPGNKEIAQMLKVPLNQEGFFLEAHMKLRPVDFATEGVFLCGLAHSPKALDESIAQASAAASRASTILSKDEIDLEANISEVVDENCDGCAYCVDPCTYKAITLLEYVRDGAIKKTVEVDESACKGCGVCQATCPKKGIFVRGFKLEQIAAQVAAALEH